MSFLICVIVQEGIDILTGHAKASNGLQGFFYNKQGIEVCAVKIWLIYC